MQKKESKLLLAAKANNFITLSKILIKTDKSKNKGRLKGQLDTNIANSDGKTALHYAATHGNIDMLRELLTRGALIDVTDNIGWRPLSYACANNKLDAVTQLIKSGSKVNIVKEENSPVHISAALGHGDIVKLLMENGANIHIQNQRNQTPVDVACENNHYGVVNVLLSASSKQIEEFSESSFRCSAKKSLNPSMLGRATLPTAMSSSNINDMLNNSSPSPADNLSFKGEVRNHTVESQDQISLPDRYLFKSYSARKSGSLNAIYLQDDDIMNDEKQITKSVRDSSKSNTLTNSNKKTEVEIMLPYPSKFSTSDILRIKSPLLPLKNNQLKERNNLHNDTEDEKNCVADFNTDRIRNRIHSTRLSNKMARSSVPMQLHYNIRSDTPTQFFPPDSRPYHQQINGKPPILKCKVKQDLNTRASHLYTQKSHKNSPLIASPYTRSTSLQECTNGNHITNVIGATNLDNDGISCHKWIKSIGLLMIWDSLVVEGFDSFLALSLATDEELFILSYNRIDYLHCIKTQLSRLSIPSINQLIFSFDVQQVLIQLGLEEYSSNFIQEGYFYVNHLPKISEKLLNQVGVTKIGHRRLLFECLRALVENQMALRYQTISNNSVSNLPSELENSIDSPTEMYNHLFPTANMKNKCQSLPRFNMYSIEPIKKAPPPIPPRSCSIPDGSSTENFTLDDVLIESMCQENISPRKKDCCASDIMDGDLSNLDDIVNMLTNLGHELDSELNHTQ